MLATICMSLSCKCELISCIYLQLLSKSDRLCAIQYLTGSDTRVLSYTNEFDPGLKAGIYVDL